MQETSHVCLDHELYRFIQVESIFSSHFFDLISLYPLLKKDNLILCFFVLQGLHFLYCKLFLLDKTKNKLLYHVS